MAEFPLAFAMAVGGFQGQGSTLPWGKANHPSGDQQGHGGMRGAAKRYPEAGRRGKPCHGKDYALVGDGLTRGPPRRFIIPERPLDQTTLNGTSFYGGFPP